MRLTAINTENTDINIKEKDLYIGEENLIHSPESIFRPIRKSEFKNLLRSRAWNKDMCVVYSDGAYYLGIYGDDYFPSGDIDYFSSEEIEKAKKFKIEREDSSDDTYIGKIRNAYAEILGGKYGKDDDDGNLDPKEDYSEAGQFISTWSDRQYIRPITQESYVNYINLNPYILLGPGIYCDAFISILYSIGGEVCQRNNLMSIYSCDSSGELSIKNTCNSIGSDIRVDFMNGVLQANSLHNKIEECVINRCRLIYGRK